MKPKFAVGERVLCFEPDRSKARVLYDAKILDADFVKDGKSKKEPEYKIHFQGWNSAWDRWADESFVLKNNPENKKLQRKLARRAIRQLKGRRRVHLPGVASVLKNAPPEEDSSDSDSSLNSDHARLLFPDDVSESDNSGSPPVVTQKRRRRSTVSSKRSEDLPGCSTDPTNTDPLLDPSVAVPSPPPRKPLQVDIPISLQQRLEEDNIMITKRNMLVDLPAKLSVVQILENYARYFALHVATLPSSEKHLKAAPPAPDTPVPEKNLNLCKEICEDLRILFDFTLPTILLYLNERDQCCRLASRTSIASDPEPTPRIKAPASSLSPKVVVKKEMGNTGTPVANNLGGKPQKEERPLASASSPTSSPSSEHRKKKKHKKTAEEQIIEETHTYLIPDQPKLDRTGLSSDAQGRRRSSRLSHHNYNQDDSHDEMVSPPMSPESGTAHESRKGRLMTSFPDSDAEDGESLSISTQTVLFLRAPTNHRHGEVKTERGCSSPMPLLCKQKERYSCTSESIRGCEMCQEAYVGSAGDDVKRAVHLAQVWKWRLLAPDYRPPAGANVPCSMIYGIHHFLRLFVKLPEVVSHMDIPDNKVKIISKHVNILLKFIAEYEREIFRFSIGYISNRVTS